MLNSMTTLKMLHISLVSGNLKWFLVSNERGLLHPSLKIQMCVFISPKQKVENVLGFEIEHV